MPLITVYRSPGGQVPPKKGDKAPRPVSLVGGGRSGTLTAFAEAAKTGMSNGR